MGPSGEIYGLDLADFTDPSVPSLRSFAPKEQMSCVIDKWLPLGQF